MRSRIATVAMAVILTIPLYAQDDVRWNGSVDAAGASNNEYNTSLRISSATERIKTGINLDWYNGRTEETTLKHQFIDKIISHTLDTLSTKKRETNIAFKVTFEYKLAPSDILSAYLSHKGIFKDNTSDERRRGAQNNYTLPSSTFARYFDANLQSVYGADNGIGIGYKHSFSDEMRLRADVGFQVSDLNDSLYHETDAYIYPPLWNPDIPMSIESEKVVVSHTKNRSDRRVDMVSMFENDLLWNVKGLSLSTGVKYSFDNVLDYRDSRMFDDIEGKWSRIDELDVDYNFSQHFADLCLIGNYKTGQLAASIDLNAQYMHYSLACNGVKTDEALTGNFMDFYGKAGLSYSFSDTHKLFLRYTRSLICPTYMQYSGTYQVSDNFLEFTEGNTSLRHTDNNLLEFGYGLRKGKFAVDLSAAYEHIDNAFGRVVYKQVETVNYYKWENTQYENNVNGYATLTWKGKTLSLLAKSYVKYKYLRNYVSSAVKNSFEYGASANVDINLKRDWVISSAITYTSATKATYSETDQDADASVKISKTFNDKLQIYLSGQDLFDMPSVTRSWDSTSSDYDTALIREERMVDSDNRAIVAGLVFKF